MFSLFSKRRSTSASINGVAITVQAGETLLQAALRQGIDFPHSCRVGGCASCKCRLLQGRVKELTETGYILSAEELAAGYILACQSVPRDDVCVEVELASRLKRPAIRGRVVLQEQLTYDITRLVVRLEERLEYQAGQYAELTLDCLPGESRCFSFASAMSDDAQVEFFIRQVPGGRFTGLVAGRSLLGQELTVDGPLGDFQLRPGQAPLLLMAGGSGLAPLLAILQAALAEGDERPVTLLFGARKARDLYVLDEISEVAAQWRAPFRFLPVLSEEPEDSPWAGARGLVTEPLVELVEPGMHAYLCGPPAMIDRAANLLRGLGMAAGDIHVDRFISRSELQALPA